MSDLNGDGVVDSADESIVSAGSDPAADLDGDGNIDTADLAIVQADSGQALPASDPLVTHPAAMNFRGDLAQTSGVALCPVGHQGLIHDEELSVGDSGSLIYNRARHLHPRLGRFMQRDPLGYVDGMSTYLYLRAQIQGLVDPSGTVSYSAGFDVYKGIGFGGSISAGYEESGCCDAHGTWWHAGNKEISVSAEAHAGIGLGGKFKVRLPWLGLRELSLLWQGPQIERSVEATFKNTACNGPFDQLCVEEQKQIDLGFSLSEGLGVFDASISGGARGSFRLKACAQASTRQECVNAKLCGNIDIEAEINVVGGFGKEWKLSDTFSDGRLGTNCYPAFSQCISF